MITGTLVLELHENANAKEFTQMLNTEYEDIGEWTFCNGKVTIEYEDKYTDSIVELIEKEAVEFASGEFYDDGDKSGEAGSFSYHKINGKAVEEFPVFLSQLNDTDKRIFKIELSEEQLNRLQIGDNVSSELVQQAINKLIDSQPYIFTLECIEDVYADDDLYWSKGGTYHVKYDGETFMADSDLSDYYGTFLSEDDFLNYFKVTDASPVVAKAMYNEGYGDMFEPFLENKFVFKIVEIDEPDYQSNSTFETKEPSVLYGVENGIGVTDSTYKFLYERVKASQDFKETFSELWDYGGQMTVYVEISENNIDVSLDIDHDNESRYYSYREGTLPLSEDEKTAIRNEVQTMLQKEGRSLTNELKKGEKNYELDR